MSDLQRALAAVKRRFVRAYEFGVPFPEIADQFNLTAGKIEDLRRLFGLAKRRQAGGLRTVTQLALKAQPKPTEKKSREAPAPMEMTAKQIRAAHALMMQGLTVRAVAEKLGLNRQQLGRVRTDSIAAWQHLRLGPAYPASHPRRRAWLRAQRRRT